MTGHDTRGACIQRTRQKDVLENFEGGVALHDDVVLVASRGEMRMAAILVLIRLAVALWLGHHDDQFFAVSTPLPLPQAISQPLTSVMIIPRECS